MRFIANSSSTQQCSMQENLTSIMRCQVLRTVDRLVLLAFDDTSKYTSSIFTMPAMIFMPILATLPAVCD